MFFVVIHFGKPLSQNPLFQHSPLGGRRPNPPACKPYGLEAGPEANWGEAPNLWNYWFICLHGKMSKLH